jgi:2-methylaconitate isomerase
MTPVPQIKLPATYMRGGTSKGVFFKLEDLPADARSPGPKLDRILLRVIGSPDPYAKHIDGMGGATSSTSKCVILSKSTRPDHDVDYLFGQISIDKPFVDWSGNCGNLTTAVGPFAIANRLIDKSRIPLNGKMTIRIWQVNIGKTIIAHVPIQNGEVQELGDFEMDGVTFPAAEVQLEFIDPAAEDPDGGGALFPTGNLIDELDVPGLGKIKATMTTAGIPTIFVNAADVGCTGTELQDDINGNPEKLAMFEAIRTSGALAMRLINSGDEAKKRQHTPKIAFVSNAKEYRASSGKVINENDIDLCVRALSMGKLHHAMMGTASVAIAVAACIPGTLVNAAAFGRDKPIAGGGAPKEVRFGHPSGVTLVGAEASLVNREWSVKKAVMSRSARVLMEGYVRIPDPSH